MCEATTQIKARFPSLEICASLGLLTEKKALELKTAGVNRFNHNLETSANYFPEVVTTHDFEDRIGTARIVKKVGLDLCCGGIFGMGESLQDRVDLAFALALYPANSMFTSGYLTTGGQDYETDKRMIEDAGFEVETTDA